MSRPETTRRAEVSLPPAGTAQADDGTTLAASAPLSEHTSPHETNV